MKNGSSKKISDTRLHLEISGKIYLQRLTRHKIDFEQALNVAVLQKLFEDGKLPAKEVIYAHLLFTGKCPQCGY